jgi:MFS family permease
MIASDLIRAVIALGFVLTLTYRHSWLLYLLSALLTFASPFFTSGRLAILPRITTQEELHTANALTQTTAWLTLSIGTMLGGVSSMRFGYGWAFLANALSFVISAWFVGGIKSPIGHFRVERVAKHERTSGWHEFMDSVRYIKAHSVILAIGLSQIGWASGGGAAQVLFTMYGKVVFKAGPAGMGFIWGFAGIGLVIGGLLAHRLGPKLDFVGYKHAIGLAFFVHGAAYVAFALMPTIGGAIVFIALSRLGMGVCNVLNRTMLLTHVSDEFRGRVFSTFEMTVNLAMMGSLMGAGLASTYFSIRGIGVVAGILSTSTAFFWFAADLAGKLKEPALEAKIIEESELAKPDTSTRVP